MRGSSNICYLVRNGYRGNDSRPVWRFRDVAMSILLDVARYVRARCSPARIARERERARRDGWEDGFNTAMRAYRAALGESGRRI